MQFITREEALALEYKGQSLVERTIMETVNVMRVGDILKFRKEEWVRKTPLNVALAPSQSDATKSFKMAETIDGHYLVTRNK